MRQDAKKTKKVNTGTINGYHSSPDFTGEANNYTQAGYINGPMIYVSDRARKPDGKAAKTFGLEIETVAEYIPVADAVSTILTAAVFPLFPAGLFKMERDGSLQPMRGHDGCGVEVITQAMTRAFIRNHYAAFKAFWDFGEDIRMLPNETCGMHCNIGLRNFGETWPEQAAAILKLHNWINMHFETACALLKRDTRRTGYCGEMPVFSSRDEFPVCSSDHYVCINYGHVLEHPETARLELRLVGPQRTYAEFRNTMEVIFHLVDASRKLTAEAMEDPRKLWKGCNLHVYDRLRDVLPEAVWAEIQHTDEVFELEGEHLYRSLRAR